MIRAGRQRTLVTVQRDRAADPADADSFGEVDPDWYTLGTRPMQIEQATGRETSRDNTRIAAQGVEFRVRYDTTLATLTEKDRLLLAGEVYDIESIINAGMRNHELRIHAVRRDGD